MKKNELIARYLLLMSLFLWTLSASADTSAALPCSNGFAGAFTCNNVMLQSQIPLRNFSTFPSAGSDLWGYVDPDDNREYALIGLSNGTAVVDVTNPVSPRVVGVVRGVPSNWREVKAFSVWNPAKKKHDAFAYVVSEGANSGLQIINLSNLPASVNQVRVDREISTAHTLLISNVEWATGKARPGLVPYLYVMGANRADFQKEAREEHEEPGPGRGLTVFDLSNPRDPKIVGTYDETYMHDIYVETITDARVAQCAEGHNPCEVVFGYTGTSGFVIIDYTDKHEPVVLSRLQYPGLSFAHSGWISRSRQWLFSFDELDELNSALNMRIRSINISNLRNPFVRYSFTDDARAIEHNGFVVGNKLYLAQYTRGLVIFDATNPTKLRKIATFDTFRQSDNAGFSGAWGVYPFLPSGNILVSDMQGGLFVLRQM